MTERVTGAPVQADDQHRSLYPSVELLT